MKKFIHFTLSCMLLASLASCGKDNKSGNKQNPYDIYGVSGIGLYTNGQTPQFGQYSVGQVINENPCISGMQQRQQIQLTIQNLPTVIPAGDVYVGVTSFGDVAAIVGTGGAPAAVAYACPRSMSMGQQTMPLVGISFGSYSNCQFKPIAAATLRFPDGSEARFRMMDFGNSMGQKFSMCR